MSDVEREAPAPNVEVVKAKVLTCVGVKVIRANGTVEEIEEFKTWPSPTPQPAKAQ